MNAIVLAALAGLGGDDDASRAELQRVAGHWAAVSIEINGEAVPEDFVKAGRLSIEGNRYQPAVGGAASPATIRLDPARRPKAIDFTFTAGPQEGQTARGIYKLDGDRLTICRGLAPDADRPAEFASGAESGLLLAVWRREPAAAQDKAREEGKEAQAKPDPAAVAAERKRFDGTWKLAGMTIDGQPAPEETFRGCSLALDGARFTFTDPKASYKGTFAIDPTASPKTIDVTFIDGPNAGEVLHGVYELEGDTYRVNMTPGSMPRPKALESKPGSGHIVQVFKRQKP